MSTSLGSTEKRLVRLFVGGAFIFLLVFEGIFLGSRIVLENRFEKDDFERATKQVMKQLVSPGEGHMRGPRPLPFDIGYLTIDAGGRIIENRIGGDSDYQSIENIIDMTLVNSIAFGKTVSYSGYYIQKNIHPRNPSLQTLIIKNGGYDFDDIIRDIMRFLALNILLLFPFWYLGRNFVREILKPVGENIEVMSHFIHDAGHELKTPLAIISGNLQILRDSKEKENELIENSISTIHAMSESLSGLVELSNLKLPKHREAIKLADHIEDLIKMRKKEIDEKKISVHIDISKDAIIHMEAKHFSILMGNLLQNAIIYNIPGGHIDIQLEGKTLFVKDTGIGMKKTDRDKIFDRFFRVDRSGKYPGSGIGLALVDRIVRLYGWTIDVESELGVGTIFSLKIK